MSTTKTAPANGKAADGQKTDGHKSRLDPNPILHQRGKILQEYGKVIHMPIGVDEKARQENSDSLNPLLADLITLRDMYKKHHWQLAGPTFYQLHKMFDKHAEALTELIDAVAERIQILGGIALAMAHDVAETTRIERPPRGREELPVQIDRLLEAHELILVDAHKIAEQAEENKDLGTADLLTSTLIPVTQMQTWFVAEHVVDVPLVKAE